MKFTCNKRNIYVSLFLSITIIMVLVLKLDTQLLSSSQFSFSSTEDTQNQNNKYTEIIDTLTKNEKKLLENEKKLSLFSDLVKQNEKKLSENEVKMTLFADAIGSDSLLTTYQKKVIETLEKDKKFTSDQTKFVRLRMGWAIAPILEQTPDNKELANQQIHICWKSLYETVMHQKSSVYKAGVMTIPYYQALKFTNMRINDVIGDILGIIYPKYSINYEKPGVLGLFDSDEAQIAIKNMNSQGYHVLSTKLKPETLKQMENNLAKLKYSPHSKFNKAARDGTVNWVQDQFETLQKVPTSFDLMTDPTILHVVQEYLGAAPMNTQVNTWWSVSDDDLNEEQAKKNKQSSQVWHQDFTWIKFIKVFVYVNDVYKDNGAHRYIPGSFKNIAPVLKFKANAYEVSNRIEDSIIQTLYPGKETYMEGQAGTVVFEDTRGFHAGTPLKKGYRQLMQLEYAVSNFRYRNDAWFTSSLCQSMLSENTLIHQKLYPRVFERFEVKANC